MFPQETSAEDLLRLTSKSLPDLTSSVEDVSSWTDNEDQEPDGEEDEGTGSSSIQGAVSVPAVPGCSAGMMSSGRQGCWGLGIKARGSVTETRMGKDHGASFVFIYFVSESSRKIYEGNAFHLRKNIETGKRIREELSMKFSEYIDF